MSHRVSFRPTGRYFACGSKEKLEEYCYKEIRKFRAWELLSQLGYQAWHKIATKICGSLITTRFYATSRYAFVSGHDFSRAETAAK